MASNSSANTPAAQQNPYAPTRAQLRAYGASVPDNRYVDWQEVRKEIEYDNQRAARNANYERTRDPNAPRERSSKDFYRGY